MRRVRRRAMKRRAMRRRAISDEKEGDEEEGIRRRRGDEEEGILAAIHRAFCSEILRVSTISSFQSLQT
jgi:hypothetical protein